MNSLSGSKHAYDAGDFNSQLSYEGWTPAGARDPVNAINDGRSISEFWFDGPVTAMSAASLLELVEVAPLAKTVVVFLYTNWCPHAIRAAVEFKEAAYTIDEQGYNASYIAVDCDEPEAARLCSAEATVTGDVPALVIFHASVVETGGEAAAEEEGSDSPAELLPGSGGDGEDAAASSGTGGEDGGSKPRSDNGNHGDGEAAVVEEGGQTPEASPEASGVDQLTYLGSIADLDAMRKAPEITNWLRERIDEHRQRVAGGGGAGEEEEQQGQGPDGGDEEHQHDDGREGEGEGDAHVEPGPDSVVGDDESDREPTHSEL